MINQVAGIGLIAIGVLLWLRDLKEFGDEIEPGTFGERETSITERISGAPNVVPITINSLYETIGERYGVDPRLLKAIARVESSERPTAVNPNDPSYGLMQVFCVADGPDSPCKNNLNVNGWSTATPHKLVNDPEFNLAIGAQIIQWNIGQFGLEKGIAVYNNWGARHDPIGGPFRNQRYVNKVLGEYAALGGSAVGF